MHYSVTLYTLTVDLAGQTRISDIMGKSGLSSLLVKVYCRVALITHLHICHPSFWLQEQVSVVKAGIEGLRKCQLLIYWAKLTASSFS